MMVVKADRDLYLSKDGAIVEAKDSSQFKLLIHQGAKIDDAWLERNGCSWDEVNERIVTSIPDMPKAKAVDEMTVTELKDFLTEKNIEFPDTAKKAELLDLAKGVEN